MNTIFLLLAQYQKLIIPIELVCEDYFRHLTPEKLLRKATSGEIDLPIVRIEKSQKSARGIHLNDLAKYLDEQRHRALVENDKLHGRQITYARRPESAP